MGKLVKTNKHPQVGHVMSLVRTQRYLQTLDCLLPISGCHPLPCLCSTSGESCRKAGCGGVACLNGSRQRVAWSWGSKDNEQGFQDTDALGQVRVLLLGLIDLDKGFPTQSSCSHQGDEKFGGAASQDLSFPTILVLLYPCVQEASQQGNMASL